MIRARNIVIAALSALVLGSCSGRGGQDGSRGATGDAPLISESLYIDEDGNGVDEGDKILVRFNRPVTTTGRVVTAIFPERAGQTFGSGAELVQSIPGSSWVEIVLGQNPVLVPGAAGTAGVTRLDVETGRGLPSAVKGTNGVNAAPRGNSIVLEDATADGPVLLDSRYVDSDNDGAVDAGDLIVATFDKPITVPAAAVVTDNFDLPVAGDSFGAAPFALATTALETNRSVTIVLGAGSSLRVEKRFSGGSLGAGSSSGLRALTAGANPITDTVSGAPSPLSDTGTVDIAEERSVFNDGRDADAIFGNDAFSADLSSQVVANPSASDLFEGTLTIDGEDIDVALCFLADTANDRVLVFEGFPAGTFPAASWVLGQPDFFTRTSSDPTVFDPTVASATRMSRPRGVAFDGASNSLFVSDTGNNRVLVWSPLFDRSGNSLALANGRAADVVLGQANFTAREANRGTTGASATSLSAPQGLSADGGRLAVADTGNNRVLVFSTLPTAPGTQPSTVLGQTGFTGRLANQGGVAGAGTLSGPTDVFISSTQSVNGSSGVVFVADAGNNRVLLFETSSPASGAAADVVLGQADFVSTGAGSADDELDTPSGVVHAGTLAFVADRGNSRVMAYGVAIANGDSGIEIGQDPAPASSANRGGAPADNTLSAPSRVEASFDGARWDLYVSDSHNNRVMTFDLVAPIADPSAVAVLGQSSFASVTPVGGGLNLPGDAIVINGSLIVSDTANSRVLIYDTVPMEVDPVPDVVLGQADLFSTSPNRGGAPTASTLAYPTGLASDDTRLVVADTGNHRILIWTAIPTMDGEAADIVLGQADFTGNLPNTGGAVAANTLSSPEGIAIGAGRLAVADRGNNRALLFRNPGTLASFADADDLVGQRAFTANEPNRGESVGSGTLNEPRDVEIGGRKGSRLYVADSGNHRVLIFSRVPKGKSRVADGVLGQPDFNRAGSPRARSDTLFSPTGLAIDTRANYLVVADSGHNRVLLFEDTSAGGPAGRATDIVLGQPGTAGELPNRGESQPGLATLSSPRGVFFNGFELFVVDSGNGRVVTYR